jgi:hypothetical protein
MTKPLPFSESRIRRAISALRKEGLPVRAVSVHPDGTITVHQCEVSIALPADPTQDAAEASKWADV